MLKIGHRGACGYVAENTIESIEKAIALGVDGIEIDIFKCKSGELVLFHDHTLKKLVGRPEKIEELTLKELSKCLVNNKYSIPKHIELILFNKTEINEAYNLEHIKFSFFEEFYKNYNNLTFKKNIIIKPIYISNNQLLN